MRRILYFILIIITFALAGLFRSMPLLVMLIAELLMIPFMFIVVIYLRRSVSANFAYSGAAITKGECAEAEICVINKGRIPAGRVSFKLSYGNGKEKKTRRKKLSGTALAGKNSLKFDIKPNYCGIIELNLNKVSVFDWLLLFGMSRKVGQTMKIAVFPPFEGNDELEIEMNGASGSTISKDQNGSGGDQKDIREYAEGDQLRHIHKNRTAQMAEPWIREFYSETDSVTGIFLDTKGITRLNEEECDRFYMFIAAFVRSALNGASGVKIRYYDEQLKELRTFEIESEDGFRDIMLALYGIESEPEGNPAALAEPGELIISTDCGVNEK